MPSPRAKLAAPALNPRCRRSSFGDSTSSRSIHCTSSFSPTLMRSCLLSRLLVTRPGCPTTARACNQPPLARCHALGQEAIDQAVSPIFGQIDDPGLAIDRDRLMTETPHRFQRHGRGWFDLRVRSDLEHVAVIVIGGEALSFDDGLAGAGDGFFAGKPGAPRRRAARAVPLRAGEAQVLTDDFLALGIKNDRGGFPPRSASFPRRDRRFSLRSILSRRSSLGPKGPAPRAEGASS